MNIEDILASKGKKKDGKKGASGSATLNGYGFSLEATFFISVIKVTFGFSTSFAMGLFIEPCASATNSFVIGGDPMISGGIEVTGGIDLGVVSAGVGISINLFELHLPPYITFKRPDQCNTIHTETLHSHTAA